MNFFIRVLAVMCLVYTLVWASTDGQRIFINYMYPLSVSVEKPTRLGDSLVLRGVNLRVPRFCKKVSGFFVSINDEGYLITPIEYSNRVDSIRKDWTVPIGNNNIIFYRIEVFCNTVGSLQALIQSQEMYLK